MFKEVPTFFSLMVSGFSQRFSGWDVWIQSHQMTNPSYFLDYTQVFTFVEVFFVFHVADCEIFQWSLYIFFCIKAYVWRHMYCLCAVSLHNAYYCLEFFSILTLPSPEFSHNLSGFVVWAILQAALFLLVIRKVCCGLL